MSKKILIVGGSGYIGRQLFARLGRDRAVATHHTHPFPGSVAFDPLTTQPESWLTAHGPFSTAILLMGATRVDACSKDPAGTDPINRDAVQSVIRACLKLGIHPLFTSSDVVFDGHKGHYAESDPPAPLLQYGRQKHHIEQFLHATNAPHTLIRLPKVYDSDPQGSSLLANWWQAIQRREPIRSAADRIFSPVHVADVVEGLITLTQSGQSGTWHLGGPVAVSMAGLFGLFAAGLRKADASIPAPDHTVCGINDLGFRERWPLDISLNSTRWIQTTGIAPQTPDAVVDAFIARLRLPFESQCGKSA
ncbi:MAG: sugar nucleotide-binding protein [Magnetococcales bacterium]|nr:sugar nucleotide-binding protein [Magnetococcales bacterium]